MRELLNKAVISAWITYMYLLHLDDSWSRDLTREKQVKKVGYKLITSDNMIGFGHELKRKGVEYPDN